MVWWWHWADWTSWGAGFPHSSRSTMICQPMNDWWWLRAHPLPPKTFPRKCCSKCSPVDKPAGNDLCALRTLDKSDELVETTSKAKDLDACHPFLNRILPGQLREKFNTVPKLKWCWLFCGKEIECKKRHTSCTPDLIVHPVAAMCLTLTRELSLVARCIQACANGWIFDDWFVGAVICMSINAYTLISVLMNQGIYKNSNAYNY